MSSVFPSRIFTFKYISCYNLLRLSKIIILLLLAEPFEENLRSRLSFVNRLIKTFSNNIFNLFEQLPFQIFVIKYEVAPLAGAELICYSIKGQIIILLTLWNFNHNCKCLLGSMQTKLTVTIIVN